MAIASPTFVTRSRKLFVCLVSFPHVSAHVLRNTFATFPTNDASGFFVAAFSNRSRNAITPYVTPRTAPTGTSANAITRNAVFAVSFAAPQPVTRFCTAFSSTFASSLLRAATFSRVRSVYFVCNSATLARISSFCASVRYADVAIARSVRAAASAFARKLASGSLPARCRAFAFVSMASRISAWSNARSFVVQNDCVKYRGTSANALKPNTLPTTLITLPSVR